MLWRNERIVGKKFIRLNRKTDTEKMKLQIATIEYNFSPFMESKTEGKAAYW